MIPHSQSLKDKRKVIKSIIERLKNKNLSVAEIGDNDNCRKAQIGFAYMSNSRDKAEEMVDRITAFIENLYPVEIVEIEYQVY
jgi:uncharacterized protein YlxP (DUF503 family)